MKYYFSLLTLIFLIVTKVEATTADELLEVHKVTTTEMNNINTPQAGSLVFNTTENTLYFYTGTVWKRLRSTGSETKVNAGNGITVSGDGTTATPYTIGTN